MKRFVVLLALPAAALTAVGCRARPEPIDYLGQAPPGDTAVVFAPGVLSLPGRFERVPAFSPDGQELFFVVTSVDWTATILHSVRRDGRWSEPDTAAFARGYGTTEPFFSPDGRRLFFASTRPPGSLPYNADLWMVERTDTGWSDPVHLGPEVNSDASDYHPSVVADGTLYFASTRDTEQGDGNIYVSRFVNGAYQPARRLGDAINSAYQDWDPYVSPDERLLIFKSNRPGGYGDMDLYVSTRDAGGEWTPARNLGPRVNTSGNDDAGDLSPDGRYLFFARRFGDREMDVYWVDARAVLGDLITAH